MNIIRKQITGILIVAAVAMGWFSCSESFLDEELKTQRNDSYFNTEEGIGDAVVSLYNYFRYPFTGEQGLATTMYGTDEFTVGGDNSNHDWNDYTSNLSPSVISINSNTVSMNAVWDNMYRAISMANLVLANVDEAVTVEGSRTLYKAEASFSRAFNYFTLVQQYGGVVLKLEPSQGVERYFVRSSCEECVNRIIEDFRVAYTGLPATEQEEGRLYKDVAAHFLAKALLYRVSEINDDWNGAHKTSDLAEIITLCNEVIGKHSLASDFRDLFDFQQSDGPNEFLSEIIFAAQFSNAATAAEGNWYHLYFTSQ
ncbi:MAG: RagB/SusD family nutrient uptake outer membrane protein, partial [Mangrovibacterium sp.]